ncbi:neuralized-like protein 4 [Ischnura elegans]|uniref:neuralized-like protein 4 n=1 Tax=Ischnura elegans TaxID=197161 RepID=UPI001ED87D49|nr:neuralized-like protein 4 [Ischnura elegans]
MEMFRNMIAILSLLSVSSTEERECGFERDASPLRLSLSSRRNLTEGDWVTDFHLNRDDTAAADLLNLQLSQAVTECGGRKSVHIRGTLSGVSSSTGTNRNKYGKDELLFHTKCGKNVAVINNGLTARKLNIEQENNAVVYTNRPLKIDELLEITLEKKHTKFGHSLAIGVTTLPPAENQQLPHINSISNGSWAMYHGNTYLNGKEFVKNYGKSLDALEVGSRVGVMRSNTGSLHFFVNGEDQGPAASNVPHPVYGVVELWGNAAQASIAKS